MDNVKAEQQKRFLLGLAYWAVILAIVYVCLKYLIKLFMPFFIALIFASISRPLMKWMASETKTVRHKDGTRETVPKKVRINRRFASILSVVLLFIVIVGLLTLICVRLFDRGVDLIEQVPQLYYDTVQPGLMSIIADTENWARMIDPSTLELIESAAANVVGTVGSKVTELSGKLIIWASGVAKSIPNMLLNTIICLIATVFMAVDFDSMKEFFSINLPSRALTLATRFKDSLVDMIWQFIRSYFIIFLITTAEITVGFLIVGQAKPLLLGVIIAIFDAFPIVGSGMILLPFSIITIISGKVGKGIGLFVVYLVVVLVRQIIEPKIVGKRVGLRPLVTLVCMYAGTKLIGGIGLLALPIIAAILADLNDNGVIHLFKRSGAAVQPEVAEAPAEEAEAPSEPAEAPPEEAEAPEQEQ